ncbi:Membrane-anchored ubiquitin-fold protein 2 [Camellia lanceoleosa]|uniref:Membrane-anchored ubiquitin-fold protein 2 n=1 Tax=Camellia lanceoleosa TaxID=1840588 RepID=A0ACC0I6I7_9ERIC|nr:Membrane-anchored ubiquitin-fold protein 2 [Camellia lanceoleosa]
MMSGVQDQLEIKFRLIDGSDIGPKSFPAATSVANLKESILALWPKEKENGPRTVKDVKLISAGKILDNNMTVGDCRSPLCDIPGGVTIMHVVVQPPPLEKVSCSNFIFIFLIEQKRKHQMNKSRTSVYVLYYKSQFEGWKSIIFMLTKSSELALIFKSLNCRSMRGSW